MSRSPRPGTLAAWFGLCDAGSSCDWGCPCNFDARPTHGFCEGGYTIVAEEGRRGDVSLDRTIHAMLGHAPGALHEGNLTSTLRLINEQCTPEQRDAIELLWKSGKSGMPFDVWGTLTSTASSSGRAAPEPRCYDGSTSPGHSAPGPLP